MSSHRRAPRAAAAAALVTVLALCLGTASSHADQIGDRINGKQQQRSQVGGLIDRLQGSIAVLHTREGQLQAVIARLDTQITAQQKAVSDAQAALARLGADLAVAQQRLQDARARLATDREILARQVVAIYKLGTNSAINNLLSSENFGQFWQRYINLRRIAGGEHDIVSIVHNEADAIDALVARISADHDAQGQVTAQLAATERQLESTRGQRSAEQGALAVVVAQDQQQLALAEQSARELDQQIQDLKKQEEQLKHRAGGTGRFLWPLTGEITQGFGCTPYPFEPYDPSCPGRHFHTGLDIANGWGTPVAATDTGVVYDFPSSYGYGNHVIMVHGNGWVSVYGHLARFAVGNGEPVRGGQIIGYEGSTGNSTGPHLHFEIRLNDVPRNPLQYLP
ncbi:MAG TPA: peptidoglycan DD-metalloendopeptidase family protein [Candidatus Dormibacteraeota bacterium]|nr:peptidoglycan DD-metalloendopeptidase family protein [Candidatus Dormibacteraeota bacterium]